MASSTEPLTWVFRSCCSKDEHFLHIDAVESVVAEMRAHHAIGSCLQNKSCSGQNYVVGPDELDISDRQGVEVCCGDCLGNLLVRQTFILGEELVKPRSCYQEPPLLCIGEEVAERIPRIVAKSVELLSRGRAAQRRPRSRALHRLSTRRLSATSELNRALRPAEPRRRTAARGDSGGRFSSSFSLRLQS
jgi:hypothetical protein